MLHDKGYILNISSPRLHFVQYECAYSVQYQKNKKLDLKTACVLGRDTLGSLRSDKNQKTDKYIKVE